MKNPFIFFLIISLTALTFSGCAAFNKLVTNNALISQLAVEAATARVIHEHPAWKSETVRITDRAVSVIDGKVVTDLASLEAYVKGQIKWDKLLPEEQAIVSVLISQVRQNLEDSFRAHNVKVPSEQLVGVRQVMVWINEAAKRQ